MDSVLTHHTRYSLEELDAQYNLLVVRPDYPQIVLPKWEQRSAACRAQWQAVLQADLRYADGKRQKLDLFTCESADAPTLIYFHGGYWQRGDKSIYSFLASPFLSVGVNVAVVGYELCPDVSLPELSLRVRDSLTWLWKQADRLGLNRNRFSIMGHSAGGHITQMMLATNWPKVESGMQKDFIKSAISISPLTYLEPVRLVTAVNSVIGMSVIDAFCESPLTIRPPLTDAPQLICVGAQETEEFKRQAQIYVDAYHAQWRSIELYSVPNVDHFDILNTLADPGAPLLSKVCGYVFGRALC